MTEPDFSRCKIAIVDSDNLFCQQLQACLRDADFRVEYERNAHTGLKKIKSWKPHIIISDYVVHGMDYFEFAEKVEAMPFKSLMVVVSSHYLDSALVSQLNNLSLVSLTLQKPIKPQDLLNKIIEIIPQVDFSEQVEPPEPIDTESDYSLNDKDLQQEIARLQFEAKELPRLVASLKALTSLAREQPHKSQYLREALEQSKRTCEEIRRQRLPHLEAPIEKVTGLLSDIIEKGSLPSLKLWDYVLDELESLSEPKSRIGTATMPDVDSESTQELPFTSDFQGLLPMAQSMLPVPPQGMIPALPQGVLAAPSPGMMPVPRVKPRLPIMPHGQAFLVIGNDPGEELLNLGSRYGVSIIIKEKLEEAQAACQSTKFDLVLLLLPAAVSGERARESVVSMHEMLRELESYRETPLVILSETESMHTRIVTAHLDSSFWLSWSDLRRNDTEFLALKAIAAQSGMRPSVLIVDSDISDSEELLRELSRKCSRVETVREPDALIKAIKETRPDLILVSERTGDLSGLDLCRAISSCLSFEAITIILEVSSITPGALKGAFRAGVDGIVSKTESKESRAESMLTIWRRCLMSRRFGEAFSEKPLEVSASIRSSLEEALTKAIEDQLPLTVCLIDLSETRLNCDDFARDWKSRQNEASHASSVHHLSQTQILISAIGLRKSAVARIFQEMFETYQQINSDTNTHAFAFRCRSYPDDALSLSELLGSF